ncbi:DUF2760 domain-containing protein [Acidovorax sp. CCYZU-2555]|uniref:DUF2760 domain-containing protein n=1 Tax=Acidovorax sp. CCYZU-2555 TaxID=2835042 RepID=UPI001BCAFC70|nr:DUF2760 domain-containing protein [Acidovorax sp. CCYZU-2555]MBS7777620.1 DUF2760 domain-containing protein [Acidovorax sp. CCYZU-2555]
MNSTPPSFLSRIALAVSSFFAILGDARFAANVARLRGGEAFAADVPAPAAAPVAAAPAPVVAPVAAPAPVAPALASETSALQLLGLLQREARFVDFVQEDTTGYSDADIGAATRVVHAGCRKVLAEHFTLEPVRSEAEGSRVTLAEGFDATAVRLTGNVVGQAPFTGTLGHRGWRVSATRLPQLTDAKAASVVAQAEVEL